MVVLRRGDQEAVGAQQLPPHTGHRFRVAALVTNVRVEQREIADLGQLHRHPGWSRLAGVAQQRGVVGLASQAPGYGNN